MSRLILLISCLLLAFAASAKSAYVGGKVDIDEPVAGNLKAAGGRITVNAPVEGSASLAGGSITVRGAIKGGLRAAGGRITIDGPIDGDASVAGGRLELGPNARIAGSLRFRGGDLERDPAAQVLGTIDHRAARDRHASLPRGLGWLMWTATLMIIAAIIAAALPGPSQRMIRELRTHPWKAPLLGFIALTSIPVAAVLVMVTIIGIPLGVLALVGYALLLLAGYVCLSVVIGGLLLERFKADGVALGTWRAGAAVLTMLALALLARIPFVGGLVLLVALVVGVGLIVGATLRRRDDPPATVGPASA